MKIHPDPDGNHRRSSRKRRRLRYRMLRGVLLALLALVSATVAPVLVLRFADPPTSSFMLRARLAAIAQGRAGYRLEYRWHDESRISPLARLAVVAAEDQRFPTHHGFDLVAIQEAWQANRRGRRLRGASTISQQVAKNLFLWPGQSLLRKGVEAYFTILIELLWPKRRILEVYLNIAEFGDGVYGVGAAAQRFFGKPAAALDAGEAALLAAVLPNPLRFRAEQPSAYVLSRRDWIHGQMRQLGGPAYLEDL